MRLDSLGTRLAALLTLAILPLGLIAVLQTYRAIDEARQKTEAALLGETQRVARLERGAIESAIGAAEALAVVVPRLAGDPEVCRRVLADFVSSEESIHFTGYVPTAGVMTCASRGTSDFSDTANFGPDMAEPRVIVRVTEAGRISGLASILVSAPVFSADEMAGYVTVALSLEDMDVGTAEAAGGLVSPRDVIIFNAEGDVLTSTVGLDSAEQRLPANRSLKALVGSGPTVFRDVSDLGQPRIYTLTPLIDDRVYALAIWPQDAGVGGLWRWTVPTIALPLLMWATSLGVAIFAVHRLVIRHVRRLRKRMRLFSRFRRVEEDEDDENLPTELAEVIESFVAMAHTIIQDEAEQENSLREKDALLREIYHRVRNNLQLIASINNMQIRASHAPEAKHVLRRLQDRIMALATIHGSLYDAGAFSKVRVDTLVKDLATQITGKTRHAERHVAVRAETVPLMLHPDQAVPLALLVVEALTNAVKHLGHPSDDSDPMISIALTEDADGAIELTVENTIGRSGVVAFPGRSHDGLGMHLMDAFVTQLDGKKSIHHTDRIYRLSVRFDAQHYGEEAAIA